MGYLVMSRPQVFDGFPWGVAQGQKRGVRRDDAVGHPGVAGGACLEDLRHGRGDIIRKITQGIRTDRIDPIDLIPATRALRRGESPETVAGVLQPVLDLGTDVEGVIDAPALRSPGIFRDEERDHEGLEHAPSPARDQSHSPIP